MLIILHLKWEKVDDLMLISVVATEEDTQHTIRKLQSAHHTVYKYVGQRAPQIKYFYTYRCFFLFDQGLQR